MKHVYATYLLVAANIGVFAAGVATGRYETWLELYRFTGTGFLAGDLASLLAAGFLHADVFHLLFNMVFLSLFGRAAEPVLGTWKTLTVFVAGVAAGNVAFALLFPGSAAVGASGGVYSILVAAMLLTPERKIHSWFPLPVSVVAVFYVVGAAAQMFTLTGGVAHVAHIGGAAAGAVLTFTWRPKQAGKGLLIAVSVLVLLVLFGVL